MTPKALMISRYNAFVKRDWKYIAETSTSQTLQELKMMPEIEWLKLDVVDDYEDIVEFKAYYKENGKMGVLHEKSHFIQENGVWKYHDGELFNTKIERNTLCPCGSGKKFKKCCA
jgi:SEC-C motif-containing protein